MMHVFALEEIDAARTTLVTSQVWVKNLNVSILRQAENKLLGSFLFSSALV